MLVERRKDRLIVDAGEFREYLDQRLKNLAELMTNVIQSFSLIAAALILLYFNASPYLYIPVFILPFLTKEYLSERLNRWLHGQFDELTRFL